MTTMRASAGPFRNQLADIRPVHGCQTAEPLADRQQFGAHRICGRDRDGNLFRCGRQSFDVFEQFGEFADGEFNGTRMALSAQETAI